MRLLGSTATQNAAGHGLTALGDSLCEFARAGKVDAAALHAGLRPFPGGVERAATIVDQLGIRWVDDGLCDRRALATATRLEQVGRSVTGTNGQYARIASISGSDGEQLARGWWFHQAAEVLGSDGQTYALDGVTAPRPIPHEVWVAASQGQSAAPRVATYPVAMSLVGNDAPLRAAIDELAHAAAHPGAR